MAHLITESDRTYSNRNAEWHGKAIVPCDAAGNPVASLDESHLGDIMFPVIPLENLKGRVRKFTETWTDADGNECSNTDEWEDVDCSQFQAVAADLRARGQGIVPLGMHTDSYKVIENSRIWTAIKKGLENFPHTITTAGTLNGCKRFYVSAQLSADGQGFEVNGERFNAYLNFISSHDGSLACQAFDSSIRIVCNNTLTYAESAQSAKGHRVHVKHTQGADLELVNVSAWIDGVLSGRISFAEHYSRAQETPVEKATVMQALTGYFWRKTGKNDRLSTRTRNQVDEIFQAFESGRGNKGETMADFLNGITEHYTSGSGTGLSRKGAPVTLEQKHAASMFGSAAEIKTEFARILLQADGTELQELVTMGRDRGMDAYRGNEPAPVYMSGLERTRAQQAPAPVKVIDFSGASTALPVAVQPRPAGLSDLDLLLSGQAVPV